jgi:hypothetical protein
MYYSVSVDDNSMAVHLTRSVLKSAVYPVQWMRLVTVCCGMTVQKMGMLAVSVRKMKALTETLHTVTLVQVDRM